LELGIPFSNTGASWTHRFGRWG